MLERGGPFGGAGAYAQEMDEVDTFIRKRQAESLANETFTTRATLQGSRQPDPPVCANTLPMDGHGNGWLPAITGRSNFATADARGVQTRKSFAASGTGLPGCRRTSRSRIFGITWEEIEPYYTRAEEMMGTCPARPAT